jgi:hypothetical protein
MQEEEAQALDPRAGIESWLKWLELQGELETAKQNQV